MPRRRVTKKKISLNETKKKSSGPKRSDNKPSDFKLSAAAPEYIPLSYLTANEPIRSPSRNVASGMGAAVENAVAIDCEMVGVGWGGKESALAHVAIVDFNGRPIYDKYVLPTKKIKDYRTEFSGITENTLKGLDKTEHSFKKVQAEVSGILLGKTVVGHGLVNDFIALQLDPKYFSIWDTTTIPMYQREVMIRDEIKRQPRKLKDLAKEFANNSIQRADKIGHSPLEDARASMNLYRIAKGYPKIVYTNMSK